MTYEFKKGLDLPITGAPEARVDDAPVPQNVALIGTDYLGLKPKMLVQEGDQVRRGQAVFCDKDNSEILFTAPMTGQVTAINRGARRVLESVVVSVTDPNDAGEDFGKLSEEQISNGPREDLAERLLKSGLWTSFRTRPYSKVPSGDSVPDAIFVTAMDTEPLAPDAAMILREAQSDFTLGLRAVARLSGGPTYLCQAPGTELAGAQIDGVEVHEFSGPHPAGLAGTHMHFLMPPTTSRVVWTIGYQDVISIGRLMRTGHLDSERIIAISGPRASDPRYLRTVLGASLDQLTDGEIKDDAPCRVISGSVLSGRKADGAHAFLGRYARQVTLITEDHKQITLGWITPQPNKYSSQPVLISALSKKLYDLTSNLNGGRRAMVPTGTFETLMPQDFLPTQLLRSLLVKDTDTAQALGALELDEEDLALCAFACPAKYEYGEALRDSLAKIEKEG